jgi:hypothetical protein
MTLIENVLLTYYVWAADISDSSMLMRATLWAMTGDNDEVVREADYNRGIP